MKNNSIKTFFLCLLLSASSVLTAQDAEAVYVEGIALDEYGRRTQDLSKLPKMERDIEILKNVLNDLFNGTRERFYGSNSNEGIYIPGRGVIFNMSSLSRYGNVLFAETIAIGMAGDEKEVPVDQSVKKSSEDMNKERRADLEEKSKQFLLNYGSLLSELKPNEKVMLNIDFTEYQEKASGQNSQDGVLYVSASRRNNKRMVSSIKYSDIEAYMDGKLDESAAESKIEMDIIDKTDSDKRDVKIFAGIMDDLFNSMADGKFKRRGRTSYTYFDGFGLMYNLKFSSNTSGAVVFATADGAVIETTNNQNERKKRDEHYKEVEEAFPGFERQLKQNILEYGRTLRSVKEDEVIIVNVDLGSTYRKTKIPRSLQMIIPKKLINEYAKGSKSLEKAAEEIDIKRLSTSINSGGRTMGVGYSAAPATTEAPVVVGHLSRSSGQN